ncbi:MAG: 4-(cytidine 5'-diphospho)-2-C-methyl-D-erythritol kinase [Acidimicrobiales bacterium]|nr:4-(cytidine 5'-diphospho)-2-C-methyl-D-erythritol kinase [Acidimicrobiales bacterium]
MPTTTVTAPAKLTVSLRVTGVRADGFHLIDAEMVTLDLADELEFSDGDGLEVIGASGLPVPSDDDNLVRKALRLVGRTAHVRLTKRIPAGAGLGGGSADAAAVLRWAGVDDGSLAVQLGADVPFCVRGGRARVTGIGEVLEPLDHVDRTFTLVTPPFGCSTPAVYRAWDGLGGPTGSGANDLEAAALVVEPRLAEWRDRLARDTGATPVLAGSGSTWFVEGEFPAAGLVVRTVAPGDGQGFAV